MTVRQCDKCYDNSATTHTTSDTTTIRQPYDNGYDNVRQCDICHNHGSAGAQGQAHSSHEACTRRGDWVLSRVESSYKYFFLC